jgi:hypothetical protein
MSIANPDTLIAVSAYAGDKHQVENNMELYLHHGCPVVIFSPADSPIKSVTARGVHCQWHGRAGWIGKHTLERHILYLRALLTFPQKYFPSTRTRFAFTEDSTIHLRRAGHHLVNEVLDTNPGPSLPKIAMRRHTSNRRTIVAQLDQLANLPTSYYGPPKNPNGWPMPFRPTVSTITYCSFPTSADTSTEAFRWEDFETASENGLRRWPTRSVGTELFCSSVKTPLALLRLRHEHEHFCRLHRCFFLTAFSTPHFGIGTKAKCLPLFVGNGPYEPSSGPEGDGATIVVASKPFRQNPESSLDSFNLRPCLIESNLYGRLCCCVHAE